LLLMGHILVVQFPNPDFLEHILCNYLCAIDDNTLMS
jgi:hypothetical protein